MTVPLIGTGHGLALDALSPFIVDPQCPDGVQFAQRDYSADGTIHEQGAFCVLIWPVIDGVEDLDALLTQMGLEEDADQRAAVTAYLPTKRRKWHLYNAYANIPPTINYALWPSNLRVMLNALTQIG
jgi:hypothetical protein